jgi:hypothetical protein
MAEFDVLLRDESGERELTDRPSGHSSKYVMVPIFVGPDHGLA